MSEPLTTWHYDGTRWQLGDRFHHAGPVVRWVRPGNNVQMSWEAMSDFKEWGGILMDAYFNPDDTIVDAEHLVMTVTHLGCVFNMLPWLHLCRKVCRMPVLRGNRNLRKRFFELVKKEMWLQLDIEE